MNLIEALHQSIENLHGKEVADMWRDRPADLRGLDLTADVEGADIDWQEANEMADWHAAEEMG